MQLINSIDRATGQINEFNEGEVRIVTALASQAAVAYTNRQLIVGLSNEVRHTTELKDAEKELNQKLRTAYQDLERTVDELKDASKKVRTVRIVAAAFTVVALAVGAFFFVKPKQGLSEILESSRAPAAQSGPNASVSMFQVNASPILSSIVLTGILAPLEIIHITGPFEGSIEDINFNYGQLVKKDQLLLTIDSRRLQADLRTAKTAYYNALEKKAEYDNWLDSSKVQDAKRSLLKARMGLDNQERLAVETKSLFEKGIIPESEYDSAQRQLVTMRMDYESAVESHDAVINQGKGKALEIADFELKNAKMRVDDLESKIKSATIHSPVDGIVCSAPAPKASKLDAERQSRRGNRS